MLQITPAPAYGQGSFIALSDDGKISFSKEFIRNNNLTRSEYVYIAVDETLRRLYFSFAEEAGHAAYPFIRVNDKIKPIIRVGRLCRNYAWVKPKTSKRYDPEILANPERIESLNYSYRITIGYSWSKDQNFKDKQTHPQDAGVYRLKKNNVVVRIGEAVNIAYRFIEHVKEYLDKVDTYDYMIVMDEYERKQEEKRLLEIYRDSTGSLPEYNKMVK